MIFDRRTFLAGFAGALTFSAIPAGPASASATTRSFIAKLGRRQVGETSITLSRSGSRVDAEIVAMLDISILGIINFDYHLVNRESWRDGVLQEMQSTTNNNGKDESVSARRVSNGLLVEGTGYEGVIQGNPGTTSYFTSDFLARPTWISSQNGKPLALTHRNAGADTFTTSEGTLSCTRYTTRGALDIDLYYDQSNEWVGSSFRVATQRAKIEMSNRGQSFNEIWHG